MRPRNFKSRKPSNIPSDAQKTPCVKKSALKIGTTLWTRAITAVSVVRSGQNKGIHATINERKTPRKPATV